MELGQPEHITEDFVFFWNSPYSQWFTRANLFEDDLGYKYSSSEKYMMVKKAEYFKDFEIAAKMQATDSPRKVKALGRQVKNFNNDEWNDVKTDIVTEGNRLKFSQNPDLLEFMTLHKDKELVEASPVDPIWGIGLHPTEENIEDRTTWKGLNLLGKCIMQARKQLLQC